MRVLVTGASGFLGSTVCDALLARGDEAVGLTRDPAAGPAGESDRHLARLESGRRAPPCECPRRRRRRRQPDRRADRPALDRRREAAHPGKPRAVHQEPGRRDQRRRAAPEDAGQPVGRRLLRRSWRGAGRRVHRARVDFRRRGLRRLGGGGARGRESRDARRRGTQRAGARSRSWTAEAAPAPLQAGARRSAGGWRSVHALDPRRRRGSRCCSGHWTQRTRRAPTTRPHPTRSRTGSSRRRSDGRWAARQSFRCRSSR